VDGFFHWSEEFVLGLEEIDEQHRKIAEVLNRLLSNYQSISKNPESDNTNQEPLTVGMNLLYGELERHFHNEEKLMQEVDYPDYQDHALEHLMLLAEMKNYCERFANHAEDLDLSTLNSFKTWLITHMLGDQDLVDHVLSVRTAGGTQGSTDGRN
jgi:hemerythrin-like metal-binding protein